MESTWKQHCRRWSWMGAAALILAQDCDSLLTRPSLYNQIVVSTVRRDGRPVAGVGLELYIGARPMSYGTSDSSGRFVFQRVPQGGYGVLVTSLPHDFEIANNPAGGPPVDFFDKLDVRNDTTIQLQFTLLERGPGTIVAKVVDASDSGLADVRVQLYSPAAIVAEARTDSTGYASFAAVPYGQYGVIVTRPLFYRDFQSPGDSLYTYRDGLYVESGSTDSTTVRLQRCMGTIRASAVDEAGNAVQSATVTLYSPSEQLGLGYTGSDGRVELHAPCAISMGLYINPPVGYSVPSGRTSSFFDGLAVANGGTTDVVFRLQQQR